MYTHIPLSNPMFTSNYLIPTYSLWLKFMFLLAPQPRPSGSVLAFTGRDLPAVPCLAQVGPRPLVLVCLSCRMCLFNAGGGPGSRRDRAIKSRTTSVFLGAILPQPSQHTFNSKASLVTATEEQVLWPPWSRELGSTRSSVCS